MKNLNTIVTFIVALIFSGASAQEWHEQGLVAHYKFDVDYSSTSGEDLGNSFNVSHTANRFGDTLSAIQMTNSYIEGNSFHLPDSTEERSFSVWIKIDSLPEPASFVFFYGRRVQGRGQGLVVLDDGRLLYSGFLSNFGTNGAVPMQQWMHIGMTYDADTAKLFIDGQIVSAALVGGIWWTENSNPNLNFGMLDRVSVGQGFGPVDLFHGAIDDFRAYNRELTPDEVLMLANDSLMVTDTTVSDTTVNDTIISSIGHLHSQDELLVYPNPVTDVVTIKGLNSVSRVEIFTTTGELVRQLITSGVMNLTGLNRGMYLLRITTEDRTYTKTLIKN